MSYKLWGVSVRKLNNPKLVTSKTQFVKFSAAHSKIVNRKHQNLIIQ